MSRIITSHHHELIQKLVLEISDRDLSSIAAELTELISIIHQDIPEKKRISTGRYSIVKALGKELYIRLNEAEVDILTFANSIFIDPDLDPFVRSIAVQIFSLAGLDSGDPKTILPVFEKAAADDDWIVRECSSGLVRKLTRAFPDLMRAWYLDLVQSEDPNQRRFVSESLRPVVENKWFQKDPEYALGIIQNLYYESDPYPRTSVGNSLSDWLRVDENIAWPIVEELASNGDQNSHWIAYRACRNLVQKDPLKVMELLGVEEYKYKSRIHKKEDYQ
jgi:3-methyladenine DNA glycosylase AlkC